MTQPTSPPQNTDWLIEPTIPKREYFTEQENYDFALAEYKKKLETFQARMALHNSCKEYTENEIKEKAEQEEELLKSPFFRLMVECDEKGEPKQRRQFPNYEFFTPYNTEEAALGYGKSAIRDPFKTAKVAEWLNETFDFKTDLESGILYIYDGKSWIPNAEGYVKKIVSIILGKEDRENHFKNILFSLQGLTLCNVAFSQKIACDNGLLDVTTQQPTPFSKKEMPFHQISVKYDIEAKCPNWEAFISQVVNGDDLATIQEWSGFLLLPDYRFHKLLWIQGEGRNGKGVWQRTMEAILGQTNVSNIGLEEFDGGHRFSMERLYGKLFNPCSEPRTNKELQTNLLKYATGQDTIEAEIKGKQKRIHFRNYAKITVLANRFPKVNDQTVAFKERRLFLRFPNEFTGSNQIQNIEQNWLTINDERSGILNWMLQGLKRLLEQGYFTESKTQQETEAEFLRASDPTSAWLHEVGIKDKNRVTTRSEAVESYKNYCEVYGLTIESEQTFTQKLKEVSWITVCSVKKPKQERAWKGLGLLRIDDDGKITDTVDTQDTLLHASLPPRITENILNNIQDRKGVSSVSSVSDESKLKIVAEESGLRHIEATRLCVNECVNFSKPPCPYFTNKLPKDNPVPLKCYGYKAANPGEEVS